MVIICLEYVLGLKLLIINLIIYLISIMHILIILMVIHNNYQLDKLKNICKIIVIQMNILF